jgi:5'-nucleotidase / UDP-sugar diphosphatase
MNRFNRRTVLGGAAAGLALSLAPAALAATGRAKVLMLSDLHSAYGIMPALLEAMRRIVRRDASPSLILLNGDLFEAGNVVAKRSDGELDWAFLEAVAKLAPTVINIGNHDADLVEDIAAAADRARALGITVVSNIVDKRSGRPVASSRATLDLGFPAHLVGWATNSIDTYPKAIRPNLSIPAPTAWAQANLPSAPPEDGLLVVMSHAGLPADRPLLSSLPDRTLFLGGHNHLTVEHAQGRSRYVHTGAWGQPLTVATIDRSRAKDPIRIARVVVDPNGPADPVLKRHVKEVLAARLQPEERAVVAKIPKALSLGDSGRRVAGLMARAAGADVGFMGHTTMGMGLPAGPLSRYAYDSVVRFDGVIVKAEVDAATLADILTRADQDRGFPFDKLTGDFAYAGRVTAGDKPRYAIVTTDWCAGRQKEYFGREDLTFSPTDLKVKPSILKGLAAG